MNTSVGVAQLVSNQAIGTVIAALLQMRKYSRAATIPQTGEYQVPTFQYPGYAVAMTARTQEAYQLQADVTQHASEDGTIFSDHVILRPIRLDLDFEVSNSDGLGPDAYLAQQALAQAISIWENRQRFDLLTTHMWLRDMVCLSLRPENEAPEWGKLRFRATFQQAKPVKLQTVSYDPKNVLGGTPPDSPATPGDASNAVVPTSGPANGLSVVDASTPTRGVITQATTSNLFAPLTNAFPLSRAGGF